MNEYLDMFLEESEEHIQVMSDEMMKFEQNPKNLDIVAVMFRAAHTLKGMAGSMGFEKTQKLTHTIENMMDDIRNEIIEPNEQTIDFMFKGIEKLELLLNEIRDTGSEQTSVEDILNEEVKTQPAQTSVKKEIQFELSDIEKDVMSEAKELGQNVFQIHFELREDCLLKAVRINMFFKELTNLGEIVKITPEEDDFENEDFDGVLDLLFISKNSKDEVEGLINKLSEVKLISASEFHINLEDDKGEEEAELTSNSTEIKMKKPEPKKETEDTGDQRKQTTSIRVNLEKIDYLMGLFEELIVEKGRLLNIASRVKDKELSESLETLSRNSTEMQASLLSMRMIPLDTILNRFPRMVRTTSKELGKNINFVIEGAETELDRTVVEELGDPLVHLLRNSLDHGVELPQLRKERGKNEQGLILLKAYHRGNEAVIEIQDDGNGIDVDKIRNKVLKKGLLTNKELEMQSDEQVIQYIFSSGLSTADKITNLSGRGVGLDVVKTKIESLGGTVKVSTEIGIGTTFKIVLPLTLSIIESLLVNEKGQNFAVPLSNVVETITIQKDLMQEIMGRKVIYYRDEILNTHRFGELFNNGMSEGEHYALIIQNSYQKYALLVNEIIGQQEIVLKPLRGYIKELPGVIGATVLGDGSVSFVLDVNKFQN